MNANMLHTNFFNLLCNARVAFVVGCSDLTSFSTIFQTGRSSSNGSVSAWHASGPEFDPHVRHILSWRLGHEKLSTAILPLPLIQEEQLSVTGERMCTNTGKLPRRLAQEQCG